MSAIDAGPRHQNGTHHSEPIRWIVLGCFAAELALLIGARGALAGILLISLATWFWWTGYGHSETEIDAIALGNALGIMAGLAFGFPQIILPLFIAANAICFTSLRRIYKLHHPRLLIPLLVTWPIAAFGSAFLSINLNVFNL